MTVLNELMQRIESWEKNPRFEIVFFNTRKNGDYEIVVRDTKTENKGAENENDE